MQINSTGTGDINAVLAQMRQIRAQSQAGLGPLKAADAMSDTASLGAGAPGVNRAQFGQALKSAIDSVNELQQVSSRSATDFVTGKEDDLVKVMVNSQKASLGFQAMVQVRNRMVSAYQDIMNMPI